MFRVCFGPWSRVACKAASQRNIGNRCVRTNRDLLDAGNLRGGEEDNFLAEIKINERQIKEAVGKL